MGRLLFFVPGEKKGARPFPLFLRAGKGVIWGAPLPGRKKAFFCIHRFIYVIII